MTKNKIIAMLLAVVLVLSLVVVPTQVSAANEYTVRLSAADGSNVITAQPGDTVTLVLNVENNPGIIGVGVALAYPQGLTVTNAVLPPQDIMNMMMQAQVVVQPTYSPFANNPFIVWLNMATGTMTNNLVNYNGKISEVTFKIADDAQPGDYPITMTAPSDKNTTASVGGDGKILPNTNTPITDVVTVGCTIRVESAQCPHGNWSAWEDVAGEAADCENPGREVRYCGLCNEPEYRNKSELGHSFTTYTETTGATCITNAKETATCDNGCGATDEREVPDSATGVHSFQGQPWNSNNDATCTADGTRYRICSVSGCGAQETPSVDPGTKLTHSYTGTALTYPATQANCHAAATYYHTCVNGCNGQGTTTFSYGSVNPGKHDGQTELRNAEPATEEAPGYTGDLWCLGCNTIIETGRPIDQLDHTHNMQNMPANGKTCTTDGNIAYYICTKCNKLYNDAVGTIELQPADVVIPASHELTFVAAEPNSCTGDGRVAHYHCDVCQKNYADAQGKNLIADVTVPAHGHDMKRTAPQTPDCVNPGNYEYYTCQICHKLFTDEAGHNETNADAMYRPATGHDMSRVAAKGKDCVNPGNIEHYECKTCNKLYADLQGKTELQPADVVIPASHELTFVAADANSCTTGGNVAHYHCSACGNNYQDAQATTLIADVNVPAAGHNMQKTAAAASDCVNPGNIEYYTCLTCQKLYLDVQGNTETDAAAVVIPADGHDMNRVAEKGKDCVNPGNIEHYECKTCNKLFADQEGKTQLQPADVVIPASHELTFVEADSNSCTEDGNVSYYHCNVCNKNYSDEQGNNLIADVKVPAHGHDMKKTAPQTPDCVNPGNYEYYTCQICHKLFTDEAGHNETNADAMYRPATGHDMTMTIAKGESCTEPGNIAYYTCNTCNKIYKDAQGNEEIQLQDTVIPAQHKLVKTEANPNSCTEDGNIEYYTCSVCGKIYKEAEAINEITLAETVITAKGHNIEKVAEKPADCTEQGNIEHYACQNGCGELYADEAGAEKLEASDVFIEKLGHDLEEHKATEATVDKEGNVLYYSCKTCQKLLAADKTTVIEEKDTVVPKLPKPESETPPAGDGFDVSLCIAVMLLACLSLALTVVIRKKVER